MVGGPEHGNFVNYCTGNGTKYRRGITGTVILPITVPVIFRGVMMAIPVRLHQWGVGGGAEGDRPLPLQY